MLKVSSIFVETYFHLLEITICDKKNLCILYDETCHNKI